MFTEHPVCSERSVGPNYPGRRDYQFLIGASWPVRSGEVIQINPLTQTGEPKDDEQQTLLRRSGTTSTSHHYARGDVVARDGIEPPPPASPTNSRRSPTNSR